MIIILVFLFVASGFLYNNYKNIFKLKYGKYNFYVKKI
jgi:hypothetical protein